MRRIWGYQAPQAHNTILYPQLWVYWFQRWALQYSSNVPILTAVCILTSHCVRGVIDEQQFLVAVCFHTALLVFDAPGRIQRQESWSRSAIYLTACSVTHRHSRGIWENSLMFVMLISLLSCPCSPVIDFLWLKFECIDPSVRQLALCFIVTVNICYFNTFPRLGLFFFC